MEVDIKLDQNLFFTNLKKENKNDVLEFMGNNLFENGYVKENYTSSIINREREYPTGLPSTTFSIAIPHTDHDLVNTTTISVATLADTVEFDNMADNQESLDVKVIIMLAISEPKGQIEMLQKITGIIQDEDLKQNMIKSKDNEELLNIIKKELGGK